MLQVIELNSSRWFSLEDYDGEVWVKAILGGHEYHVSNYGRIKEPGYIQMREKGRVRKYPKKPFIKSSKDNGKGYYTIAAFGHHYYVHRVVADCFVPNLFNYPEVDHINGDRSDNRAENLRWVDRAANMANPLTRAKHRQHSDSLYVPIVQLDAVTGDFIKEWSGIAEAARGLGISRTNVSALVRGEGGKSLRGFRFVYLSLYDPSKDYSVKYKRGTFPGTNIVSDTWVVAYKDDNIIKLFHSTTSAAKHYGCSCSGISKRCRSQQLVRARANGISDCAFQYYKNIPDKDKAYIRENFDKLIAI